MHLFNDMELKSSLKADSLHRLLLAVGVNFATGVPCGVLRYLIHNILKDDRITHISVNRESEAVGIAAGAYLCGKSPIVYMQNSGLFSASNDIASLLIPFEIPILFVVSYRGIDGETAPQHFSTGRATEKLLQSLNLSFSVFQNNVDEKEVKQLYSEMLHTNMPYFILLKRGWHI